MRCVHCGTHFCYRCGARMPGDDPYSHFSLCLAGYDAAMNADQMLQDLRNQFGRQEELFALFNARVGEGTATRAPKRTWEEGSPCPTCRQWNYRAGRANHARCHACRSSYCHHCRQRIVGSVPSHYRGSDACPQHS
mmetsp:Transcript_38853/g.82554  ORF Transcript_38853/g.82554 Transcript_38853/m.82554 type:complete len:136 (-) Transcript_38853:124-531(-)